MKRPILISLFLASLVFRAGAVYADLPDLGDVSQASMSQADEDRIGREAMRELRQDGAISDDVELNHYINDIGGRLALGVQGSGLTFTFFVVDDNGINAFAMPGGYVGVNKGLILATQSEGELASVLGHEMAHVTQHHIARMEAKSTPNQLLLLGTLVAAALASRAGNSDATFGALNAGVGLSVANQLSFSRDVEREADRVGMHYLAEAGFDARDMPSFFQRLQQYERLNGIGDAYAFLRTHPVTSERISEAQNRAQGMPVRMHVNSTSYLLVREKIRCQRLEAAAAIKYYQSAIARGLYLSEGAQWYGLARSFMASDDIAGARQALVKARKLLPADPMLFGLEAEIGIKSGNWSQALAAYRAGMTAFPDNAPLVDGEIKLLLQTGQREQALAHIRTRQELTPNDPVLFRLQAEAYAVRDPLRYHAALGNALYFEQMWEAALEQYHMVSQAKGDDFYLLSSVEARIQELEKRVADDKKDGVRTDGGVMQ